jgi:hypothetical protein
MPMSEAEAIREQTRFSAVLGTLQFAIAVLSGLVVIIAVAGSLFIGNRISDISLEAERNISEIKEDSIRINETVLRDAREVVVDSKREIEKISEFYRSGLQDRVDAILAERIGSSERSLDQELERVRRSFASLHEEAKSAVVALEAVEELRTIRQRQPVDYLGPYLRISA